MNVVLCIDDDPVAQRLYSIMLKNAGYDITNATTGAMALEKIEMHRPAVAILDFMMPDLSGLDVASRIRRHTDEEIRKLPLIVCSASLDRKTVQQFTTLNVRHFLVKPVEKELLKQTLIRVMGSDWDGGAIQNIEQICYNLGIDRQSALDLLQHAVEQLEEQLPRLKEAFLAKNESGVKTHCALIRSTIGNLGLRSDHEWMMEVRGFITALETDAENPRQETEEQFTKLVGCVDRLKADVKKITAPAESPVPDVAPEATASPVLPAEPAAEAAT